MLSVCLIDLILFATINYNVKSVHLAAFDHTNGMLMFSKRHLKNGQEISNMDFSH